MPKRTKQLSYRRARYFVDPANHDLETYVRASLKAFPTNDPTRHAWANKFTMEVRHRRVKTSGGVLLHVAGYTPGEEASVVPQQKGVPQADLSTAPPPKNTDYMDGDVMLLVRGNDVLICANGLHEAKAREYFHELFAKASLHADAGNFELSRVADANRVQLIAKHGVKNLKIKASLYEASIAQAKRKSIRRKLLGSVWDELLAILSADSPSEELESKENLTAELVISFDRRKKGGELGQEQLVALASGVINDDEEGFSIETFGGETIRSDQIVLRKAVEIDAQGKSVFYDLAFSELDKYFGELVKSGLLEQ